MANLRLNGARAAPRDEDPTEEWSQLWFSLLKQHWSSLALVPAAPNVSTLAQAERLEEWAREYRTGPVHVFDARQAAPGDVAAAVAEVASRASEGERVLLVVSSPLVRPSAIPLARAASAALLVVPLGTTAARDARRTVAAVGRGHFLGSVTLRAS